MIGRGRRGRGTTRYEAANERRGQRARQHLAKQRDRELRRRKSTDRDRERARSGPSEAGLSPGLRRAALFLTALALGVLFAGPIQRMLTSVTGAGLARLETIAIQGNDHLSFEQVARATGVARGSALTEVSPTAVEARLGAEPWIRDAHVLRLPPSTLLVRVEERRAQAVLVDDARLRLVDDTGNPFAPASNEQAADLPRLLGGADLASDEVHTLLRTALELVERMHAVGSLALAPGGRLDLYLPSQGEPEGWRVHAPVEDTWVVLGREHVMERFERLVELLENEEVTGSIRGGTRRIDLRFSGQAVLRSASREPRAEPRHAQGTS